MDSGCQELEGEVSQEWQLMGIGFLFWCDENVLGLNSADFWKLCEYTKKLWIVHLKMVNFMVCELYLNN